MVKKGSFWTPFLTPFSAPASTVHQVSNTGYHWRSITSGIGRFGQTGSEASKRGSKKGSKMAICRYKRGKMAILEVKNGSKMAQKGVIFGTPF